MTHLVCIGFGFSARPIAVQLQNRGWKITGTSRSREGAEAIAAAGYDGIAFDPENGCSSFRDSRNSPLATATHLLISAAPGELGDPALHFHRAELEAAPNLKWVGYLSTIGVYGNHEGRWIDEDAPLIATTARSKRRLKAEDDWQALCRTKKCAYKIFRLAGIYGPGRNAIEQIKAGRARRIIKAGQVFNRIHIDDIAQAVINTIDGIGTHTIYNLADDEPAPPQDVITYAASLLAVDPPPEIAFEDAEMSAMGRSFYADLKRMKNERLRDDLGVKLLCPTYREGLSRILKAENA